MLLRSATPLLMTAALLVWSSGAAAATIDFDDLAVGEFVTNQYLASNGVTIEATNFARPFDDAITLDSLTGESDLRGPAWNGGNLAPAATVLGNVLILAENITDDDMDGLVDRPDDEGSRPAGLFDISFMDPISSFGLDLVDVESPVAEAGSLEFYFSGGLVGTLTFQDLADADASIEYGNNSANRIAPILASLFQAEAFDRVVVNLGGSAAIDNLEFEPTQVPEPGVAALLGLGLVLGAGSLRRR